VIQKISDPGRGFRRLLNYILDDKKQAEIVAGNMGGRNARTLATEFGDWRALNESVTKPVFHASLAAAPSDQVTADLWPTIAETYLERLGYAGCPWVAIRHGDTKHDHIHIIASRIDGEGHRVRDHRERQRGEAIVRDLERELGLQKVAPSRDTARVAPTRGQLASFEGTGQVAVAARLQEHLDLAARDRPTITLFVERLEAAGIQVRPNVASTGRVSGFSFALDGVAMRGSDLGRGYSWKALQETKGVTYDPDRDLPTLRAAAARAAAPPAPSNRAGSRSPEAMPPLDHPVDAYRAGALLAAQVEIYERHDRLSDLLRAAAGRVDIAERLLQERDRLRHDLETRERAFEHELGQVFEQPGDAARKLRELVDHDGPERVAELLGKHPQRLGPVRGLGVAALKSASRRGALAAARRAARQLSGIGRIRTRLGTVDEGIKSATPALGPARALAASTAAAKSRLPTPASLRREIARSARRLGPGVVRAMSLVATYWAARVLANVGRSYRDVLLERNRDRDDDGLSR
jgi:hypothetical protein